MPRSAVVAPAPRAGGSPPPRTAWPAPGQRSSSPPRPPRSRWGIKPSGRSRSCPPMEMLRPGGGPPRAPAGGARGVGGPRDAEGEAEQHGATGNGYRGEEGHGGNAHEGEG